MIFSNYNFQHLKIVFYLARHNAENNQIVTYIHCNRTWEKTGMNLPKECAQIEHFVYHPL